MFIWPRVEAVGLELGPPPWSEGNSREEDGKMWLPVQTGFGFAKDSWA